MGTYRVISDKGLHIAHYMTQQKYIDISQEALEFLFKSKNFDVFRDRLYALCDAIINDTTKELDELWRVHNDNLSV